MRFEIGQEVVITSKIRLDEGLKSGYKGKIMSINGEYHYVRPHGYTHEVELYRNEIQGV